MQTGRWIIGATSLLLVAAHPAFGAALTCDQYRTQLGGAILATGSAELHLGAFTLGYDDPARGKRFNWKDGSLSGDLKCGATGQFEEFSATVRFDKKDTFADTLSRFAAITGASICALSSSGLGACADTARTMLQGSLSQMGQAVGKGSKSPSGFSERTLFPGGKAELSAAPTIISFLIGPGRGASLDEARQPLAPLPTAEAPKP